MQPRAAHPSPGANSVLPSRLALLIAAFRYTSAPQPGVRHLTSTVLLSASAHSVPGLSDVLGLILVPSVRLRVRSFTYFSLRSSQPSAPSLRAVSPGVVPGLILVPFLLCCELFCMLQLLLFHQAGLLVDFGFQLVNEQVEIFDRAFTFLGGRRWRPLR